MKKLFFLLASIVVASGCKGSAVTCTIQTDLNQAIVSQFQALAGCQNPAALTTDLLGLESKLGNLCPSDDAKVKGVISDLCVALIPILVQQANGVKLLQDAQCDLSKGTAVDLLTKACAAIPAQLKAPKVEKAK